MIIYAWFCLTGYLSNIVFFFSTKRPYLAVINMIALLVALPLILHVLWES